MKPNEIRIVRIVAANFDLSGLSRSRVATSCGVCIGKSNRGTGESMVAVRIHHRSNDGVGFTSACASDSHAKGVGDAAMERAAGIGADAIAAFVGPRPAR